MKILALLLLLPFVAAGQTLTGSVDGFNNGDSDPDSDTCTVPMDADLVVAFWSHWDGGAGSGMNAITLNSVAFTILDQQVEDADNIGGGVAILESPSTGSQTCAWDWTAGGARTEGGPIYFVYFTGANLGDVYEDADTFSPVFSTGSENTEVTLTTVSGELILVHAMAYSPGMPDITGDTVVDSTNDEELGVHFSDLGTITAAGSSTLIEMTGEQYSLMSAIALKPAAAGTGALLKRRRMLQ